MLKELSKYHHIAKSAYNLAADKYHMLFQNEMNEKEYDRNLLNDFAGKLPSGSLICDAGCGPSAHIGKYLFDKGFSVIGVDISDRCVELASGFNPGMKFICNDIAKMDFDDSTIDGIVSYYSIIHTPKKYVYCLFNEFSRVLKPGGYLLVAVKEGEQEGVLSQLIGIDTQIYFSLFKQEEIEEYFHRSGFRVDFIEKRNPYDFEIKNERIFAIGQKI